MRILGVVLAFGLIVGAACGSGAEQASSPADCDGVDIGSEGDVVAIYRVSGGSVTGLCVGTESPLLLETWDKLVAVSPPDELASIIALAGFESETSDTAAFTAPLFDNNEAFVVAVNLSIADDDADESQLTMVHELAHVFTLEGDQIDFQADPATCETFYNGSGCFFEDSYVVSWIRRFWTDDQIDGLPADGSVDEAAGQDRCTTDESFLGGYAASHPEEDLAESFAAYVFSLTTGPGVDAKLAFFDEYPELAAFHDRAVAVGASGLANNFEKCG